MTFRHDIQGLRAVCVILVMLHHAFVPGFGGGFVGVDVFFVLSGFLITGLILREIRTTGQLDVVNFWARRARRLLPNALLVLAVTFLVALSTGQSLVRAALLHDLAAASLYLSNFHFANQATDYFSAGAAQSPVLHFWSLSIEEQYYLFFPVVLWLGIRFFRQRTELRIGILLSAVAAISFAICLHYLVRSQPDAFFRTEARIWQIAAGGILAAAYTQIERVSPALRCGLAWAGLLALAALSLLVTEAWRYPGLIALAPVAAAAAVIAGGNASPSAPSVVLSSGPMRFIGDASYSLYLWHFPVMILMEAQWPDVAHIRLLALGVAIPLALLAFYVVEQPIRVSGHGGAALFRRAATLTAGAVGSLGSAAAFIAVGTAVAARMPQEALLAKAATEDLPRLGDCAPKQYETRMDTCLFGTPGASKRVTLLGDSYAVHLFPGVEAAAEKMGWQLRVRTKPGCPPLDTFAFNADAKAPDTWCMQWRRAVMAEIETDKPDLVIVTTWAHFATLMHDPKTLQRLPREASEQVWGEGLARTLKRIAATGSKVVFVRTMPAPRPRLIACLAGGTKEACNRPRADALRQSEVVIPLLRTMADVTLLDFAERLCTANTCRAVVDGKIAYSDDSGHITATFSRMLTADFVALMQR